MERDVGRPVRHRAPGLALAPSARGVRRPAERALDYGVGDGGGRFTGILALVQHGCVTRNDGKPPDRITDH